MFRLLLQIACIALMGYIGYTLWHMDPAQTQGWARSDYPWIRDVSRVVVALVGAMIVGGIAWKLTDGLLSIIESK